MSAWSCSASNCGSRTLFYHGDCPSCRGHYCGRHLEDKAHHACVGSTDRGRKMELNEQNIKELLASLDLDSIAAHAKALRPGFDCAPPDLSKTLKAAGTNIHIPITFSDGVEWLVRIRQNHLSPLPYEASRLNALSEVATYRALCAHGVKSPQAWPVPLDASNPGLVYFFVERISGADHDLFMRYRGTEDLSEQDFNAITEYAKWMLTFERVIFDSVGSPTLDSAGNVAVGPVMDRFMLLPSNPYYLGPYSSARQRYIDHFETRMRLVMDEKWCVPKAKLQIYLEMLEARTLVEQCVDGELDEGPFYLKHGEPKGDHILYADTQEVSGLIDWEWATTTCKADAFAAPFAFLDRGYGQGSNNLTTLEKALAFAYDSLGRPDLGDSVRRGKKYQRLTDMLQGCPSGVDNLVGLREGFAGPATKAPPTSMRSWVRRAAKRYGADPGVKALLALTGGELPTHYLLPSGSWTSR